jgi:hypothetical protein
VRRRRSDPIVNNENLGPAERIIQSLLTYQDHMIHNRPGIVVADATQSVGVRWEPVTHKEEGEPKEKVVYRLVKAGNKNTKVRIGVMNANGEIRENGALIGRYRPAGIFPEVLTWMYRQVAEVWKLDNEFAARWASYAFGQEHRDLKVVLAAFMLVQARKGDPVLDQGKVAFHDDDFRDVGEAMMLLHTKGAKTDFNPKLLLRVRDVLVEPSVAAINRELGFGRSARNAFLGRWTKAVEKWLAFREENPKLLEGLVKAGFRTTVMDLARAVGYKPITPKFFETLRWKQAQAEDGRRTLAIGQGVTAAESWEGLNETEICERVVKDKPNYKRIVGLVPKSVGLTRAIVAAAIEAGSFSNKDLLIATPTLEELGLLQVQDIKERWDRAVKASDDMRAANIARNVKSKDIKESLVEAADNALKKAVEEVTKDMRIYVMVDTSGSMEGAIDAAKRHLARFVQGFPLDRLHVCTFTTGGRAIEIKHASAAGVEQAFRGIAAGGGTDYGSAVRFLAGNKPKAGEDALFFFVGDEGAPHFDKDVRDSGLNPVAFALVPTISPRYGRGSAVTVTAQRLGIPCFEVREETFADPYAIPRTLRALIAATPVGAVQAAAAKPRLTLAEQIVKQPLLVKPAWAA